MTRRRRSAVAAVVLIVGVSSVAAAVAVQREQPGQAAKPLPKSEARARNLRAYEELLRSDIRTQKVALITEIMQFTESEDSVFWPIYREYELELTRINDDRLRLIETYATVYDKLTPETASDLVEKALALESRRTALKQKCWTKLKTALSPRTAAKFLQVENQIQLLLDLQIAASLPVLQ